MYGRSAQRSQRSPSFDSVCVFLLLLCYSCVGSLCSISPSAFPFDTACTFAALLSSQYCSLCLRIDFSAAVCCWCTFVLPSLLSVESHCYNGPCTPLVQASARRESLHHCECCRRWSRYSTADLCISDRRQSKRAKREIRPVEVSDGVGEGREKRSAAALLSTVTIVLAAYITSSSDCSLSPSALSLPPPSSAHTER